MKEQDKNQLFALAATEGIAIHKDGLFVDLNDPLLELLEYDKAELINRSIYDIIASDFHSLVKENIQKKFNQFYEIALIKKDGSLLHLKIQGKTIIINGQEFRVTVARDQTERKQFEQALIESEEKYQKAFRNVPSAVYLATFPEGKLIEFNNAFEDISGYTRDELIGKTVVELNFYIEPEDRATLHETIQNDGKLVGHELIYRRKSGAHRLCSINAEPMMIGKNMYLVGNISDITEHRKAQLELIASEEALRESEASSRALLNATTEIEFLLDKEYNIITLNDAYAKSLGKSNKSLIGTNVFDNSSLESARNRKKYFEEVNRTGKPIRFQDYNGTKYFDNSIYPVVNEDGEISRFAVYANDITERKIAQDEIRKSEIKFSSAFYTSPLVMAISKLATGEIITVNDAVEATFGYRKEEVIGRSVVDEGIYIFPENRMEILGKLKDGLKIQGLEIEVRKKNGDIIEVEMSASLLQLEDVPCMLTIVEDVSVKKQSERELQTYQSNLRSLVTELASVEDKEKRKIAEYLHDNLGQSLALARIKTGKLLRKVGDKDLSEILNEIEIDISDAINYTQSVIYELSPPILYELGLLEALKWKLDDFEKKHGIKSRLICPAEITKFNEEINLVMFRSITELLNNVVKHADASKVELEIIEDPEKTVFTLSDDGIGFDQDLSHIDHAKRQKYGLFSIKERMKEYGFNMEISSEAGKGSIITFFVTLDKIT